MADDGREYRQATHPANSVRQVSCWRGAALLLLRHGAKRPNKRAMEMIRFYLVGLASLDEFTEVLGLKKKSA